MRGADVVVIGGGVIGSSIAYQLARRGVRVTLLEAREVASAASGASAGGVRQQGRDPRELAIAMRAIAMWPTLADELGADLDYISAGPPDAGGRRGTVARAGSRVAEQRAGGWMSTCSMARSCARWRLASRRACWRAHIARPMATPTRSGRPKPLPTRLPGTARRCWNARRSPGCSSRAGACVASRRRMDRWRQTT